MSKNVKIDGKSFSGVSQVKLNTTDGGTALFKDVDEITTPSGTKSITANGSYDVSDFATAEVNVPTEGGATLQELTITENGTFTPASGFDGFSKVIANIAASGLPIHTGEEVITNANTQHRINHNLNLSAYVCIFWRADIDEYIAGTENSNSIIVSGISAYNFDTGLASKGQHSKTHVWAKWYKQTDGSWGASNTNDSATTVASSDENKCYIKTTSPLASGTYKWVIIDITSLNIGGA